MASSLRGLNRHSALRRFAAVLQQIAFEVRLGGNPALPVSVGARHVDLSSRAVHGHVEGLSIAVQCWCDVTASH